MRSDVALESVFRGPSESEHRREVPTRGMPHHRDPVRIHTEARRVGSYPADRPLAVMDLCRPSGLVGQAVADARTRETPGLDERTNRSDAALMITLQPAPAVDVHDDRKRFLHRRFERKCQRQSMPGIAVPGVVDIGNQANPG